MLQQLQAMNEILQGPPKAITALTQSCNWGARQRCNSAAVVVMPCLREPSRLALISRSGHVWASRSVAFRMLGSRQSATSGNGPGGGGSVAVEGHGELESSSSEPKTALQFLHVVWRFMRPYALSGALVQAAALVARALLVDHPDLLDWSQLHRLVLGVLALTCLYGFYCGSNQLYDIDIDKVNKPHLPLAAGDLSERAAWFLVWGYALSGLALAVTQLGPATAFIYVLGLLATAAYSVPPLRFKNHSATAIPCIMTVRACTITGTSVAVVGQELFRWTPFRLFALAYLLVSAGVVAFVKDSGDVDGDRKHGVVTFASVLGVRKVTLVGAGILFANLVAGVAAAVVWPHLFKRHVLIPAHLGLALFLGFQLRSLDASDYSRKALDHFYKQVWNFVYAQCALLPFI